jgi:hydroxypyruvate reductase
MPGTRHPDPRRILLSVFDRALAAVHGRDRVRNALEGVAGTQPWRVIAVGKAASAMTLGAFDVLEGRVERALVISKDEHFDAELLGNASAECIAAGHPIPDERSLQAGTRLLEFLRQVPSSQGLLLLISGGASSLVEALPDGVTLQDLTRINQWLLAAGHDIVGINAVRRRLSRLKNGGLLAELTGREAHALFISDVPGDDPALIGSGLLSTPRADPPPANLPPWIVNLIARAPVAERASAAISIRVIATLADAVAAARGAGESLGLKVRAAGTRFSGSALELATRFCHELATADPAIHVWGGESTVRLPRKPGKGGRNQHLALAAARLLVVHDDLTLLAAGTDGSDGSTTDAGALVDSQTIERATLAGFDADECLARADAASFLEASGDLLHTGPTGTNVGDLVLGLKRV